MPPLARTETPTISDAVLRRPRRFSFVWILPVIALLIGGFLIYNQFIEKDLIVQVHFDSGAGLVAGKTQVKHKGVIIGYLKSFRLDDDIKGVIATVAVNRNAEAVLREETLFWLVEPRISLEGVTGLETLVSGAYIEIRPGKGRPSKTFDALSAPPPLPRSEPGLHLTLTSGDLGSIRQGTPILYRKVVVGSVQSYEFNPDNTGLLIHIHIKSKYADLVTPCSRFWNSSGISLSGDLGGLTLRTESLMSIVAGGISFHNPKTDTVPKGEICRNGDTFTLFTDYQSAHAGIPVTIAFDSAGGLTPGKTKVMYKGVAVGLLKELTIGTSLDGIVGHFVFDPSSEEALNESTRFWAVKPRLSFTEVSGLDTLLSGVYLEMDFELGGRAKTHFTLLKDPPVRNGRRTGLAITLKSPTLSSISRGTPLLYRGLKVGSVLTHRLTDHSDAVLIDAIVEEPYTGLIHANTAFWNSSGITVKGGLKGLEIQAESLESLVSGGIAFETPGNQGPPADPRQVFTLHASRDQALSGGIPITIRFDRGRGLKPGAPIRYRDVDLGRVTAVVPSEDLSAVTVYAELDPHARDLARQGSRFWVVGPSLGLTETAHLDTLISGPYLAVLPGKGDPGRQFTGLTRPPADARRADGLAIVLRAPRRGSIKAGNPIRYKDVTVGTVVSVRLADAADHVLIDAVVDDAYAPLVRTTSRFWNVSGMKLDAGLFRGVRFDMDSVASLIEGGIAFATPDPPDMGEPASAQRIFDLADDPDPAWLNWSPAIPLSR
ncbi:PqiB family protein [Desulfatiferula olefinivorans]